MKQNLTDYAIKNSRFTLIIVLMICVLGVTTLLNMPRAEDPNIDAPSYPITIIYPGASPTIIEESVIKPLEQKIYTLEGIDKIQTKISSGVGFMFVEYRYGYDVDVKFNELTREVNAIRPDLPEGIYSLTIEEIDPSMTNILQMELVSENAPKSLLDKYARSLQEELEKVEALKEVKIFGMPDPILRINMDLDKMQQMHISVDLVSKAIKSALVQIPGGKIIEGSKVFNVKAHSDFNSLEDFENIIVGGHEGRTIYLKDLAEITYDFMPETHIVRLNGYRAVSVVAALKKDRNISAVQTEYLARIQNVKSQLPENIDLVLHFDQAENVKSRLNGLLRDFIIAISLVIFTLLPLGNRASLVVMTAIPLSLLIGVISLNAFGYSLNQLSIVGFVIALGLLVDDSIVVVENIERWMREGFPRKEATVKATKQITNAVLGCTATLVIAFLPLLFLPDKAGDFISSLPISIVGTILGSLLVALTIVPFIGGLILKPHATEHGNIFLQHLQRGIHAVYTPILDRALKIPRLTTLLAMLIFALSLLIIPIIGLSLFPASEKPQFIIDVTTPLQSNIYHTDSVMREVEKELENTPEVQFYTTNVGRGNPQIYYNVIQKNEQSNFGEIFVQLRKDIKYTEKIAIINHLRGRLSPRLGAIIEIKDFQQGIPIEAPVEVKVLGENLDTIRKIAKDVDQILQNTEGTMYVNNPTKNLESNIRVRISKEKAAAFGVPTANIDIAVRTAIAGQPLGTFNKQSDENNDYTILLTMHRPDYPNLRIFDKIMVDNVQGKLIPLTQIADIGLESAPVSITHLNKERKTSVSAFVEDAYITDNVARAVIKQMDQYAFPNGYRYEMGGEMEGRSDSFRGFDKVIIAAVFLFIAILVLQFKTFRSTLIVLSVIPLGIVGAVIALWIAGETLSFVATVGLVALAGIEVKNTILQVDFTNELRENGIPLDTAIERAGEARFLPILLTTITTIFGLTPIALSSNPIIAPLAIVIIGGLISSTFLSRIVTPVMYKIIPPKIEIRKHSSALR